MTPKYSFVLEIFKDIKDMTRHYVDLNTKQAYI